MKRMKTLLIIMSLTFLNADWKTNLKLEHIELSNEYVANMESNKRVNRMCRNHIAKTQVFKDNMKDTDKDNAKLEHYIRMVKFYCSKAAGCKCQRD